MINTDLIRALRHFQPKFIDFLNYTNIDYVNNIRICLGNEEHYIITFDPLAFSTYGIYKLDGVNRFGPRLYSFPDKREMTLVEVKNLIADYKYKDDLYAVMKYIDYFLMDKDFDNLSKNYYLS
jgi:hypothetical protein